MNQLEKEKSKLKKELLTRTKKSMKNRLYTFSYFDKSNSETFKTVFDIVVNDINTHVDEYGFTLEYSCEIQRTFETKFNKYTVYTVNVVIASDADKFIAKTTKSKAKDGDAIDW